ncbi:MAG: hypothetical protein JJU28_19350 [Cyclobacteriaceae bacterium]|nr:hypothetical protein [Cyclobacteriaceae bacterium]
MKLGGSCLGILVAIIAFWIVFEGAPLRIDSNINIKTNRTIKSEIMNKLSLAIATIMISVGANAQSDSINVKMNWHDNETVDFKSIQEGYMFHNGEMLVVKDGIATPMENIITLNNGIMILCDGTCIKEDGTTFLFKEGEYMDMTGKMMTKK